MITTKRDDLDQCDISIILRKLADLLDVHSWNIGVTCNALSIPLEAGADADEALVTLRRQLRPEDVYMGVAELNERLPESCFCGQCGNGICEYGTPYL